MQDGPARTQVSPFPIASPRRRPARGVHGEAERRRRLLDAAASVFLDKGYAAATMDAIAVAAGMSKKTLYQIHASKLALFDALLGDRLFEIPTPEPASGTSQQERLTQLLLAIGRALLQPERVGLIRLVIVEHVETGQLSRSFERIRTQHDVYLLERWFIDEAACGRMKPVDVQSTASLLFGITVAEPLLASLIGKRPHCGPDDTDLETHVRRGVAIFLAGLEHEAPPLASAHEAGP